MHKLPALTRATLLSTLTAGLLLAAPFGASQAALITADFSGNDCSGVWGQGFNNCTVGGLAGTSPIIVKFGGGALEVNSLFPTIDGSEFAFNPTIIFGTTLTGNWTYTPNDVEDPVIRFWTAKGGSNFRFFYNIDQDIADTNDCANNPLNSTCLANALSVTSGIWSTPNNNGGNSPGLSHIAFWDTAGIPINPPVPPAGIPEPGTLALISLGVLAGGLAARRRKQAASH